MRIPSSRVRPEPGCVSRLSRTRCPVAARAAPGPPAGLNGAHLQPEKYVSSIESSREKILTSFTFPAALCSGDVCLTGTQWCTVQTRAVIELRLY
jgi:hypothetical protein